MSISAGLVRRLGESRRIGRWDHLLITRELAQLMPSPVVELNRAVALGMAFGPAAGLELVDSLNTDPALAGYHLLPSVRERELLLKKPEAL